MTEARNQTSHGDAVVVAMIEKAAPQLVAARDLFNRFQNTIRSKTLAALEGSIEDAAASLMATFAKGIVADTRAVAATITEPWSNGQTEGQITKAPRWER